MSINPDKLLPSITGAFTTKILLLESYFLIRSGRSPVYFGLADFIENYSIEILYIAVTLFLLTGWIAIPALVSYYVIFGSLSWCGRKFMSIFRYAGIPIFSALYIDNQERSVSLLQAKDYAKSQGEQDLLRRIDEYERSVSERLESEAKAAGNFVLIILILVLSYQLNAPNFLMKVSEFADPFLQGYAYKVVAFLLVAQGLVGRMTSFYLLGASGSLPPDFFRSEEERLHAENWNVEILRRYEPLVERWKHKIK